MITLLKVSLSCRVVISEDTSAKTARKTGELSMKLGIQESPTFSAAMPQNGIFAAAFLDPGRLENAPIRPEWVLEGQPEAKCETLSHTPRGWGSAAHWSCTAGSFRWEYCWDETVLFVEGEVYITDADNVVYHGRPGVSLCFPAGTNATWHVPRYIRKIAFNQKPVSWHVNKFSRLCVSLRSLVGHGQPAASGF